MKLKSTTKQPGTPKPPRRGRANLASFRRMTEAQIARTSPPELSDLPSDFWDDAVVVPQPKRAISLRVDADVLEWFRETGPRYQTRMNAVLRTYVARIRKNQRPRDKRRTAKTV